MLNYRHNTARKSQSQGTKFFGRCCLRSFLGLPMTALRYVMHFRFCGWRYVFTQLPCVASCAIPKRRQKTTGVRARISTKVRSAVVYSLRVVHRGEVCRLRLPRRVPAVVDRATRCTCKAPCASGWWASSSSSTRCCCCPSSAASASTWGSSLSTAASSACVSPSTTLLYCRISSAVARTWSRYTGLFFSGDRRSAYRMRVCRCVMASSNRPTWLDVTV